MRYKLKLSLYVALWCVAGLLAGSQLLSQSNFFIVFGIALLMVIAMILIGRRLFGRSSLPEDETPRKEIHFASNGLSMRADAAFD
jgi:hypothetical protein